jgi:hypothetical protein
MGEYLSRKKSKKLSGKSIKNSLRNKWLRRRVKRSHHMCCISQEKRTTYCKEYQDRHSGNSSKRL